MKHITLGLFLLAASSLQASHFRGAAMVPTVSATGLLTVNSTTFWRPTAVSNIGTISVAGVGGMTQVAPPVNDTSDARFTKVTDISQVQLPGAGLYDFSAGSCCRVGGIINANESSWAMNSKIFWDGRSANSPILFNFSAVQPEVVRGLNYAGNLGAVAGLGLTLTYDQALNVQINSQPPGFTINAATGALAIPAASTATYLDNPTANIGADYAFSGNIKASDGSSVEFDWLFDAVATGALNRAPVVNDAIINLILGQTANYTFTASDPDGDPLTFSLVNFLSALPPGIAPTFNPATQLFTFNSTGSALGTYIAQVQASDGSLTDVGSLTINVVSSAVPEPGSMALLAGGLGALALIRRRISKS